jgi:diguanylate cyclase (GGDEF)-like protein
MIDIDHFKRVNDQHGHQAGDKVIKQLSRILTASIRRTDAVGRYGGEEFLIVLSHTPIAPAQIFAETLRRTIEQQDFKLPYFSVTVSIGIAMLEQDQSPNQVIEQADQQLYLAKQSGRNCVRPAVNSQ